MNLAPSWKRPNSISVGVNTVTRAAWILAPPCLCSDPCTRVSIQSERNLQMSIESKYLAQANEHNVHPVSSVTFQLKTSSHRMPT